MKKIEVIAVVLIVLWVLTLVSNPIITFITARLYTPPAQAALYCTHKAMLAARNIASVLVHIGIAAWLFIQAKWDRNTSWVWALFGFTFGISAAILYFLLRLVEEMKAKRSIE